jgi:hypothetical protein
MVLGRRRVDSGTKPSEDYFSLPVIDRTKLVDRCSGVKLVDGYIDSLDFLSASLRRRTMQKCTL